jgi:Cupin domain
VALQRQAPLSRGNQLGLSLYELLPGQAQPLYHFHHGINELLLVLRGRPSLRTPDGERELAQGDVAHFPKGPTVIASSFTSPEIVEYPDSGKVAAVSRIESQRGRPALDDPSPR